MGGCSSKHGETDELPVAGKKPVTIYGTPFSANACCCTVLALDLGVGDLQTVDLMSGEHKKPEYMAIQPYGQIPGLKDGNFCMGESSAILHYLAIKYGKKYYPFDTAPQTCGKIDFAMDAFENVYTAHVKTVYTVFGFAPAPEDQPTANQQYADAMIKWLDTHVKDQKFVTGDFPCIADFRAVPFFFCAIQPCMKDKVQFEAPARVIKYCEDFFRQVAASKFMQDAGGMSIQEFAATKGAGSPPTMPAPGSAVVLSPAMGAAWKQAKPATKLKIHQMPMSQNCGGSAVMALDLDVGETEQCDLFSGAQKKPEFLAINPYGQIPALQDGSYSIGESNTVQRYIALAYGAKYYPAADDPQLCAKMDFAIQAFATVYAAHKKVVYVVMGFGEAPEDQKAANEAYVMAINQWFDIHVKDQKFVMGSTPGLADFKAVPFFYSAMQPCMKKVVGFDLPLRAIKYCEDFKDAVPASKFFDNAGGFSIKEFCASKG